MGGIVMTNDGNAILREVLPPDSSDAIEARGFCLNLEVVCSVGR